MIDVDLRDKFIIRYDYYHNLFPMFRVTYDRHPNSVNLLEEAWEGASELNLADGVKFFLFQAMDEGYTQISINEFTHQSDVVQGQRTFKVQVGKP